MAARVGIGTWVYTHKPDLDVWQVAARVAEQGYDGLELDGGERYFAPERYPTAGDRLTLLKRLRDTGLEPAGYNADLYAWPPVSPDPAVRRQYLARLQESLDLCAALEVDTLRVDTVSPPPRPQGLAAGECRTRLVDAWREGAEYAARRGVTLVWEFEPGFMFNKPSDVLQIVAAVGHPNLKVLFDTCHSHMVAAVGARQEPPPELLPGGEVQLAEALTGEIGLVHLIDSDNTIHDGFTSTHAPFGRGYIQFDRAISALLDAGYRHAWWNVDLCFWPDPEGETAAALGFVRDLLASHGVA